MRGGEECHPRACTHAFAQRQTRRRRGGIEPLYVSVPRELKSRPSTSPSHPGQNAYALCPRVATISLVREKLQIKRHCRACGTSHCLSLLPLVLAICEFRQRVCFCGVTAGSRCTTPHTCNESRQRGVVHRVCANTIAAQMCYQQLVETLRFQRPA